MDLKLKKWNIKWVTARLETLPIYWYVPMAYVVTTAFIIPVEMLANWMHISKKLVVAQNMPESSWEKILFVVLAFPLIETFISQAIPYHLLSLFGFFRRNVWLIILISSLTFGIAHDFSIQYSIHETIIGFVFISTFVLRIKNGDSFLCTFVLHAFFNLIAVLLPFFI